LRNGAANLAAKTLGVFAGRNDAVSLRTTLASAGRRTTEAIVAASQNATTGQRYRTTARNIAVSTGHHKVCLVAVESGQDSDHEPPGSERRTVGESPARPD
jgi:hypothetical protein